MRGNKRVLSFVMAFLMLFTMFFTQAGIARAATSTGKSKAILHKDQPVELFNGTSLKADPKAEGLKDSDKVRVIVELKSQPVIEHATARGIKVNELSKATINSLTTTLKKEQSTLKNEIAENNIDIKYHQSFVNVANGFSATTTYGEAKKIEAMPNVEKVSIANEYYRPVPDMNTSKDIIKALETWNVGFNGQGTMIAIIDTGIDYDHKDMKLTDNTKAKYTAKSEVDAKIAEFGLRGKWFTNKVPYGYNYYDNNYIVKDLGPDASMHGMHVAGTAGANGTDATGIKGVAPEAQLLAMKVFSNDPNFPSTFSDIYLGAIDDSIKLGADVINMSLGSTASFQRPDDPEQVALTRATQNGIVLAISAGNSGHIGYGWSTLPYAKNPDIGVVGAPGLNIDSVQVASIENSHIMADALKFKDTTMGYISAGPVHPASVFSGQVEYVFCKLGLIGTENGVAVDDFAGVDVAGKVALIQRGGYTQIAGNFVDKITNARKKGAIGVIVFNSTAGGDGLMNMAYPTGETIPAVFIGLTDGTTLKNAAAGENKVEFVSGLQKIVSNPAAGKMADSSSWGTTPNLDFKPEITAPGVSIYSTLNDNKYGIMSGTSMAAPHVAGGSALILQRVDKDFGLKGAERSLMAKNLLMSTANPLPDKGLYNSAYPAGNFTSPRKGGAGVMDLQAAATTPAIVVDKTTGISKVNLREIGEKSSFTLKVQNFGETDLSYNLSGTVGTDLVINGRNRTETGGVYKPGTISATAPYAGQFPISYSKDGASITKIDVPAKGSVEFNVSVDLAGAIDWWDNKPITELFPNGTFIEGFVRLTSTTETVPSIGLPYMGFYGEWDKAPVIDDSNYKSNKAQYYGGFTTMTWYDKAASMYNFLGYGGDGSIKEENIAFSPNGDGVADNARLLATFLRNAAEVEVRILSADGSTVLRTVGREYDSRKNYYNGGSSGSSRYKSSDNWEWDGKLNNKLAADGNYIYQFRVKVDYPGAQWQEYNFPIKVDNSKPVVQSVNFDRLAKKLTVSATDNHKVSYYQLVKDGNVVVENATGVFDLSTYADGIYNLTVNTVDFAENVTATAKEVVISQDFDIPHIYVESPAVLGIYNTKEVTVRGYITDASEIRELKVYGEVLPLTYDAAAKEYIFEKTLTLNDGVHRIKFEATDVAGNTMNFERKIWVDTKAPVINASLPAYVKADVDKINLQAVITDNFPAMNVYVNGSIVHNSNTNWLYVEGETPTTYNLITEVSLEPGENTIIIQVKDGEEGTGNISTKELTVYRDMDAPVVEVTSPAANASVEGSKVAVAGKVTDNKGVGNVKVNGKAVTVDAEGNFTTEVAFSDYGTKTIEVVAVDIAGNSTTKTISVTMNIPHVTSIAVTQDKTELERGQTAVFTAEATYSDGSKVDVTNTAEWTAEKGTMVKGAFIAPTDFSGDVKVTAKLEGVEGTATIKVKVPTVVSIAVTQDKTELERGQTAVFTAEATYSDGSKADITNKAEWITEKGSIVNGTFTAPSNLSGDVKVTAKLEGVEGTATIKVKVPTVVSIAVKQDKTELERGQSATFRAEATYSDGAKADVTNNAVWTAEKGSIANGAFTAPSDFSGVVKVTVKFDGIESSATINVKDPVVVKTYIQITASRLNVRTGPSTRYKVIGTLVKGQVVEYTALVNGWYKIVFNGQIAYVSASYAKVVQQNITSTPASGNMEVTVTASYLNVRSGAGTKYSKIGSLKRGAVVTVLGKSGSWYKINYNGKTGYISSRYTK